MNAFRRIARAATVMLCLATGVAPLSASPSDALLDDGCLHDLWIEISQSDWNSLHANYMDDTYYRCTVIWNGLAVNDVGIKQRGTSTRSPIKPGVKLSFGNFVPGQRFLGLKSLVLRNLLQEGSMGNERLAVALFGKLGLPYEREAHARVFVNGDYVGLYLMVEDVDKDFLTRQFGESKGWLYKFNWTFPYYFDYLGEDPSAYTNLWVPQTNEDNPDGATLERMVRTINEAPDASFDEAASEFFDIEQVAAHLAADVFLTEGDGFLAPWGMNNLFLYRFNGQTRFQFIPWDKSATFAEPERDLFRDIQTNVFARRLLQVPRARRAFIDTLWRCLELAEGESSWLQRQIARQYAQIREAALQDPYKPFSNEEFEITQAGLAWYTSERSRYVRGVLSALESR